MNTFISLLRGINVSGQKKIKMVDLIDLYHSLKFTDVKTYVQSGNVIFRSSLSDKGKISDVIEKGIAKKFGYDVKVLVKTNKEIKDIISKNPFLKKSNPELIYLYVTFLYDSPEKNVLDKLKGYTNPVDDFQIIGNTVYLYCPGGYGNTKLSNNFFEKTLKITATTRNWKTINMLKDISDE